MNRYRRRQLLETAREIREVALAGTVVMLFLAMAALTITMYRIMLEVL